MWYSICVCFFVICFLSSSSSAFDEQSWPNAARRYHDRSRQVASHRRLIADAKKASNSLKAFGQLMLRAYPISGVASTYSRRVRGPSMESLDERIAALAPSEAEIGALARNLTEAEGFIFYTPSGGVVPRPQTVEGVRRWQELQEQIRSKLWYEADLEKDILVSAKVSQDIAEMREWLNSTKPLRAFDVLDNVTEFIDRQRNVPEACRTELTSAWEEAINACMILDTTVQISEDSAERIRRANLQKRRVDPSTSSEDAYQNAARTAEALSRAGRFLEAADAFDEAALLAPSTAKKELALVMGSEVLLRTPKKQEGIASLKDLLNCQSKKAREGARAILEVATAPEITVEKDSSYVSPYALFASFPVENLYPKARRRQARYQLGYQYGRSGDQVRDRPRDPMSRIASYLDMMSSGVFVYWITGFVLLWPYVLVAYLIAQTRGFR